VKRGKKERKRRNKEKEVLYFIKFISSDDETNFISGSELCTQSLD
jgi:hypothetical protein